MKVYHGTYLKNFKPNNAKTGRYNIPVLFFSDNIKLSENFAIFNQKKQGKGYLYAVTIPDYINGILFNEITCNASFRRYIEDFLYSDKKSISFLKCLDRPSNDFILEVADIFAIKDFSIIKNIELIKEF